VLDDETLREHARGAESQASGSGGQANTGWPTSDWPRIEPDPPRGGRSRGKRAKPEPPDSGSDISSTWFTPSGGTGVETLARVARALRNEDDPDEDGQPPE
jgi:hypothetical protein